METQRKTAEKRGRGSRVAGSFTLFIPSFCRFILSASVPLFVSLASLSLSFWSVPRTR